MHRFMPGVGRRNRTDNGYEEACGWMWNVWVAEESSSVERNLLLTVQAVPDLKDLQTLVS